MPHKCTYATKVILLQLYNPWYRDCQAFNIPQQVTYHLGGERPWPLYVHNLALVTSKQHPYQHHEAVSYTHQ